MTEVAPKTQIEPLREFVAARIADEVAWAIAARKPRRRFGVPASGSRLSYARLVLAKSTVERRLIRNAAHLSPARYEEVLRDLAAYYADHPDYRQEWATA